MSLSVVTHVPLRVQVAQGVELHDKFHCALVAGCPGLFRGGAWGVWSACGGGSHGSWVAVTAVRPGPRLLMGRVGGEEKDDVSRVLCTLQPGDIAAEGGAGLSEWCAGQRRCLHHGLLGPGLPQLLCAR